MVCGGFPSVGFGWRSLGAARSQLEGTGALALRPKILASCPHANHVKRRICSERGNRPRRPQRDPTRDLVPEEVLNNPPFRDRCPEAPHARARAPASPSWPDSGVVITSGRERGLRFTKRSLQREEHGCPTEASWAVSGRVRPPHRGVGAVCLQLGRGQSSSARPAFGGHLRAQEPWSSTSERDPGSSQSRVATANCENQVLVRTNWLLMLGANGRGNSGAPSRPEPMRTVPS